jgi:hypothetical protein
MFRTFEDCVIVLGALLIFTIWLLIFLPLYYPPPHPIGMATALPASVSILVGFLGGSVTAWIFGLINTRRNRPIISVRLVQGGAVTSQPLATIRLRTMLDFCDCLSKIRADHRSKIAKDMSPASRER